MVNVNKQCPDEIILQDFKQYPNMLLSVAYRLAKEAGCYLTWRPDRGVVMAYIAVSL